MGFFAQGGAGNAYEDLVTAFGTRDELSSIFRIAKLTPGFSYQVTDGLAVGGSLAIIYADIKQNVFPDTSFFNGENPAQSFFGFSLKDAHALKAGFKLGAMYRANDQVTLGVSYTSKTHLPLSGGTLTANLNAFGLGEVTYRDVRIDGLALPVEVGIGALFRLAGRLLIAVECNWLNWSGALRTLTLRASNPDNPAAPPSLQDAAALNWKDQYVFAIGVAYDLTDTTMLLAGYNYGKSPIPHETTNPLLAAIGQRHLTGGISHRLGQEWTALAGFEYLLPEKVTYSNPALPFGPNSEERDSYVALHIQFSRRW